MTFTFIRNLFTRKTDNPEVEMKYLIAGLGNIGSEYSHTRHNIGFDILDEMAGQNSLSFEEKRYGSVVDYRFKGRNFILLKPNTYVNLSGKAVNYWLQKEKVPVSKLLVVVDDLALPFGTLRIKPKGGDAGHNGLKSIQAVLGTTNYARLRFGIGNNFNKGQQVDYVLGRWSSDEKEILKEKRDVAIQIIKSFGTIGTAQAMNQFNNR